MSTTIVTTGGSANVFTTNELPVDMWKKRMRAYASLTPLTVILARLANDPAHNFQVDLIEENEVPYTLEVATTESTAGATIYVKEYGTTLVQDSLLYNPDKDDLRLVDSQPSANTVTVTVDQGGTTSSAWEQGDIIFALPPALPENDSLSTFRLASAVDSRIYNLMQICKLQYSLTRLANRMQTHFGGPGSKRTQLKKQKYREYRIKDELLRWLGGRQTGGTAPATKRMSNGIVRILKDGTLYKDFNGTFTETGFDNFLGDYYDQNPDATNILFAAAPSVIRKVSQFAKDKIRISPKSKAYGLSLNRYIGGDLEVDLVRLPLFAKTAATKGWGFLLDLSRIKLKDVDKPTFYPDAQNVGESENIIDTYRSVSSMLVANESRHAMCVGATL